MNADEKGEPGTGREQQSEQSRVRGLFARAIPADLGDLMQAAIPLGIGVILTGVFAALGVDGDLRDRLFRNNPRAVTVALVAAIVAVALPVLARIFDEEGAARRFLTGLGAALLMVAAGFAVYVAIDGVGNREQPTIAVATLSIDEATDSVTINVTAGARSLASDDHMLMRVAGFDPSVTVVQAIRGCGDTRREDIFGSPVDTKDEDSSDDVLSGLQPDDATVFFSGETGSDGSGAASEVAVVEISRTEFRYACVHAVLSSGNTANADRNSTVEVDVRQPADAN